jgi:hypothetical protein
MNAIESPLVAIPRQNADAPFPATAQLLVQGGDARIALSPATGANKYGCRPHPDPAIAAFGSATATGISEASFFAANQLRNRLAQQVATNDPADVYADGMNRVRHELIELCGLGDLHGLDIVFAASGTDSHLIAAQLVVGASTSAVRILMVAEAETGSGVPTALSVPNAEVAVIPLRLSDGTPRPAADIDADFEQQTVAAAAAGQRVLLGMVDVSKTGMIAPSVACAVDLLRRFPDTLDVLVDVCQFRITSATLQAYLAQGFMVSITGSKFITGPSFTGALLIPAGMAKKLRNSAAGNHLKTCSTKADWPSGWRAASQLDDVANFGLLLRWEAALKELRAFRSISNIVITHFLQAFAAAVSQRLASDPAFEALPVFELQRQPLAGTLGWDNIQTIFPFLCRAEKKSLSAEETAYIYRALQDDALGSERVQLAQPVPCGMRDGVAVSALRLCVSSRLIVEATQQNGRNEQTVIARALKALDKVAQYTKK